eukprot:1149343-Pelagomonas_calceolata.AAC.1
MCSQGLASMSRRPPHSVPVTSSRAHSHTQLFSTSTLLQRPSPPSLTEPTHYPSPTKFLSCAAPPPPSAPLHT